MSGPFHGSLVALPTPMRGGAIDFAALLGLIERQIASGTRGLVAVGSTGEAPALTLRERTAVVEFCRRAAGGRVPVLAGVGTSSTRAACQLAREAADVGADGLLASTPPYSRPSQRGLAEHFAAIAGAATLPLVLYNIPGRTAVDLLPETVAELAAEHPSIVAIKEASGSLARIEELVALRALDVLSGEDELLVDALHRGAVGVIGVVGNVVPQRIAELVEMVLAGDVEHRAPGLVEEVAPLVRALALESNPVPLKAALAALGLCADELRLPLVPLATEHRDRLQGALARLGLVPA